MADSILDDFNVSEVREASRPAAAEPRHASPPKGNDSYLVDVFGNDDFETEEKPPEPKNGN